MVRLPHFGQATPVPRYLNWAVAALVTLCAVYLHALFFLNAGGLWRDEAELVHLSTQIPVIRCQIKAVWLFLMASLQKAVDRRMCNK